VKVVRPFCQFFVGTEISSFTSLENSSCFETAERSNRTLFACCLLHRVLIVTFLTLFRSDLLFLSALVALRAIFAASGAAT
jgi:hypothetical protein